jgi:hypothetical protein
MPPGPLSPSTRYSPSSPTSVGLVRSRAVASATQAAAGWLPADPRARRAIAIGTPAIGLALTAAAILLHGRANLFSHRHEGR